jgi:hypothetical protein
MRNTQSACCGGGQLSWEIDLEVIARVLRWPTRHPALLEQELAGMALYFPRWLLLGARGGRAVRCEACQAPAAPIAGAIRCPRCRTEFEADGLTWRGDIPALARGEPRFTGRLAALNAAGYATVESAGSTYLLAPLAVSYPGEWPNLEPTVRYAPRWLRALGLPTASAAHHLVGNGQACLFAWGQWQHMPVHAVLQQRVVNHLASLLKIVAGYSPEDAFIGRIHHDRWVPDATRQ